MVDSTAVDHSSDVLGVNIMTLSQPTETADVNQTFQLPDGTVAVIKNLSQRQYYQCRLVHYVN